MMKNLYLSALGIFVFGATMAQQIQERVNFRPAEKVADRADSQEGRVYERESAGVQGNSRGAVLFYEDFEFGLGGNNGMPSPTWTVGGSQSALWVHETTGPGWGSYPTFVSNESHADGWMRLNLYSTWPSGNYTIVTDAKLTSPTIDLTGYPAVRLSFINEFIHCCNFEHEMKVEVSTNNFVTTTTYVFDDAGSVPRNEFNIDHVDTEVSIDISAAIAASPSTTKFRFFWDGRLPDANTQHAVIYWWMIDDVRITEMDPYDIKANAVIATSSAGDPLYTKMPFRVAFPIDIECGVLNVGTETNTNVQVNASVDGDASGNVYTGSMTPATLAYQQGDTFLLSTTWTPGAVEDSYAISSYAFSDSSLVHDVTGNNRDTLFFEVTDTVWARDNGIFGGRQSPSHDGSVNREIAIGNQFTFHQAATAVSVSFWLSVTSSVTAGPLAKIALWQWGGGGAQDWNEIYASSDFDVTQEMIDAEWVTVRFDSPIDIPAGEEYAAMIYHYSQIDTINTGVSTANDFGQGIYWSWSTTSSQFTMFGAGTAPLVRLNLAPADISVNETAEVGKLITSPNPFNDELSLSFELNSGAPVTVNIVDIAGKTVLSEEFGTMIAGKHRLSVNTKDIGKGVYFCNVTTGTAMKSSKLIKID